MTVDVAVVGAGPYGLSLASHLRARGVDHRAFGHPMQVWRTQMPQGMFLKSEGFASNLSDPSGTFPLARYCADRGVPYADIGVPTSREVFAEYGLAFQRRFVPHLEQVDVSHIGRTADGFGLTLATGETLAARRVVLAVGISHFAYMPPELAALPATVASHSSHHADLSGFAGREVVVLGAGASALDCAALLVRAGAAVRLVARAAKIQFHDGPTKLPRPLLQRLRAPLSGLGPGWRSRLATDAPLLFHVLPADIRMLVVQRHLGPAPGYWTRGMVEGKVEFRLGQQVRDAREQDGRVELTLAGADGAVTSLTADHVIAATGYRADVQRLAFLSADLRAGLRTTGEQPALSRNFESSASGLYFVGLAASYSFGPVLRFAFGADFTSRRLARHLGRRPLLSFSRRPKLAVNLQVGAAR